MGKNLAKIFSVILHPLVLPSIMVIILYNSGSVLEFLPYQAKKVYLIIIAIGTFILPLTFVPFFIFQKIIKSVQMDSSRERLIPFLITSLLYLFCYYLLSFKIETPSTLRAIILAGSISTFLLFLSSFFWKISAHMVGIGGLIGALIAVSFKLNVNLEYFIIAATIASGILGYSRLVLEKHKPYQIYLGWLLGLIISIIVISL